MKRTGNGLSVAVLQGVGARDAQQDALTVEKIGKSRVLAAVADGMGGLVNSHQVSQCLVDIIKNAYAPNPERPQLHQLLTLLDGGVRAVEKLTADQKYSSGSTLVCCLVEGDQFSWLSVGDSRICLWRKGGLIQLNRDHDFARDMAILSLHGTCTLEEIATNPRREALTSYIGGEFPKYIDFNSQPIRLLKGDKLILMSDGIYRSVTEEQLAKCMKKRGKTCIRSIEKLIRKKAHPQQDNYTAIVIGI